MSTNAFVAIRQQMNSQQSFGRPEYHLIHRKIVYFLFLFKYNTIREINLCQQLIKTCPFVDINPSYINCDK